MITQRLLVPPMVFLEYIYSIPDACHNFTPDEFSQKFIKEHPVVDKMYYIIDNNVNNFNEPHIFELSFKKKSDVTVFLLTSSYGRYLK